jgi:hypothetical protein
MAHIRTQQETSMTRISTFALATLTVIAAASLTSTGASARGGGGAFGGGSFAGGFSGSAGHSFGSVSASGGYAHLPVGGIARSSVISRMPVGSRIARSSVIARLSPPAKTGSRIPTTTHISQFPKGPVTVRTPDHNHPKPDGVGVAVDIACGNVASDTVGLDSQAVQVAQPICNCLTKQVLDDGSVLFQDICSKETTLATPVEPSVAY